MFYKALRSGVSVAASGTSHKMIIISATAPQHVAVSGHGSGQLQQQQQQHHNCNNCREYDEVNSIKVITHNF